MQLIKIKGNTYYIDAPTNIGVYVFKNKTCLLIDTGIDNSQAAKIDEIIKENGLHPRYIINTHTHTDHCGGNNYFKKNYPGCVVYASEEEKIFLEHPDLHNTILFSASPLKQLGKTSKNGGVDFILEYGTLRLDEKRLEIYALPGHTADHIGVVTPENVCFCGDALFSENIMNKYSLPNLFDIESSRSTLAFIKNIETDFFVIGHMEGFIDREEAVKLAEANLENINTFEEQILELLEQPLTREDLLENIAVLNDLILDFKEYHLAFGTISAFIKYMCERHSITFTIENGKLYYFKA
ncbi:MAG TPA: MBL fold metallo-hydrolase [Syntrophomonadaceae bacterium]|nr:MBL fold metallo-hydrolase [Syntrophomonadaceae bacterium]